MGDALRAMDWSATPLGPRGDWPQCLRIAVNICLNSRFPMFVWWGPQRINIYNDAYVPMLGRRHPRALGRPARDSWDDIWDVVGPQADAVFDRGEATWNERVLLVMERHGYPEHTWFTWSYSPVYDEDGRDVVGMFCAVTEETDRVRAEAERDRLAQQRQLALDAARMGWWHYDPLTKVATFDERYEEIVGLAGPSRPNEDALRRIHPDDLPGVLARVEAALAPVDPRPYSAEYRVVRDDGSVRWVEAHGTATFDGEGAGRRATSFVGTVADITGRKQAEQLQAAQSRALELIAAGAPLADALGTLTRAVEEQSGGLAVASILLLEDDGQTMRTGAAPGLPAAYNAAIDGVKARCGLGTCADAAARNEVVVTPDLATAESWRGLAHLPLALGLKAAWSMPIRGSDGRVLGTFGTYFRECRGPTGRERQLVEGLCRMAALAVERRRAEEQLRRGHDTFYNLIQNNPFGVYVVDADFRLRQVSLGSQKVFAHVPPPLLGRDFAEVLRSIWAEPFATEAVARFRHTLETGEPYAAAPSTVERRNDIDAVEAYDWRIERVTLPDGRFGVVCYFYDLSERKAAERERQHLLDAERSARAEAERASRMKDEFLATLSHELRTPLNAILGWSQILGAGERDEADLAEGLRTIERNARVQTQIIEDLLDMSRIISGKVRLDVRRIDLAPVVAAAAETVRPAAEARGVRLQVALDPAAGPVRGDPGRLQQVFWNLLSNAVKFTPRGGHVRVRLARADSHVEVSVTDTGEGIRPEFLPYVFDRFRQADASTTRRHGGLGLGLAIVRHLVELHGGSIHAHSPGAGQGARFAVRLPPGAADPAEPLPVDGEDGAQARTLPARLPDTRDRIAGVRVLVVDDEPDARNLVRRLLEDCHAVVTTAASAAEAVERVRTDRPDVLVSDVGMPDEDGYALIRRVRALGPAGGGDVPAVALTAYARAEDRVKAILAGFQLHVAKPVEPAELLATVASLAGRTATTP